MADFSLCEVFRKYRDDKTVRVVFLQMKTDRGTHLFCEVRKGADTLQSHGIGIYELSNEMEKLSEDKQLRDKWENRIDGLPL